MARKRFFDEDVRLLRQIEVKTASGASVAEACRSAGVSDATYYRWRKKFGGMGASKVRPMKTSKIDTCYNAPHEHKITKSRYHKW